MNELNPLAIQFQHALNVSRLAAQQCQESELRVEKVHVVGSGGTATAVYEQLRNAAENAEEELLLQKAIRRFYKRIFLTPDNPRAGKSGGELLVELTLAGYIANDSVPTETIAQIDQIAGMFAKTRHKLSERGISLKTLDRWTLDILAVQVESLFTDHSDAAVFANFAFSHFRETINPEKIFGNKLPPNYETALFVAIHRRLLKADPAVTRAALISRYQISASHTDAFARTNDQIDELFDSKLVDKLSRIVDRQSASLRVLNRMMKNHDNFAALLSNESAFMADYEAEIVATYGAINDRINRGVAKSVVFLIITKFLIGLAIEVPYDLWINGHILWTPLAINLLFPPIYMILLRLTLTLPSSANTTALARETRQMLFGAAAKNQLSASSAQQKKFGVGYNIIYTLFILAVFGGVGYGLWLLGFEWIHLVIFFIFMSAASFLGFRLSRLIREVETVDSAQNGVTMIRDFLYMPFVVVGRWMSESYSKMNIVTIILDMVIELPLKTVLRLFRQWGAFVSAKKDEL